jgi:hypothetical protein
MTLSDDEDEAESEIEMIKIIVKIVGEAEDLELSIPDFATVLDLKEEISEKLIASDSSKKDLPVHRQRLIFGGRMLHDDDFLLDDVKMKLDRPNHVHLAPIPRRVVAPGSQQRNQGASSVYSEEGSPHSPSGGRPLRRLRSRELRRSQVSPYGSPAARQPSSALLRRYLDSVAETEEEDRSPLPINHAPFIGGSGYAAVASAPFVSPVQSMLCREPAMFDSATQLRFADAVARSLDNVSSASLPAVAPHLTSEDIARALGVINSRDIAVVAERDALVLTSELLPRCRILSQQLSRFLSPYPAMNHVELEDTVALLELVAHQGLGLASSLRQVAIARQQTVAQVSPLFAHRQTTSLHPSISEGTTNPLNAFLGQTYHIYPSGYF